MFKRLQNKLLIMNMTITSLVILGAFSVVYLTTYNNIKTENERKLSNLAGPGMTVHSSGIDEDIPDIFNKSDESGKEYNMMVSNPTDYSPSFVLNIDENNKILSVESFFDMPQEVYDEAASIVVNDASNIRVNFYDRQWLYSVSPYVITVILDDGRVKDVCDGSYRAVFLDITDTQKTLSDLLVTFLFVMLAVLIVIFFVCLYFAKRAIKPISEAWERQRQFIADASHELKTPLSIITANYDALLANENETIQSQRQWLEYMKIGTDRMTKLINSLLSLVKMENKDIDIAKASFDLSDAIADNIKAIETMANEKQLTVTQLLEPNTVVCTDKAMVEQIFTILYENAIKYTENGGEIKVSVSRNGSVVSCSVFNTGKGIKKHDIARIFDRFYRADQSRNEETGGYGLGLSIAKTAVERIGGSISVESIENEWTRFTFTLG